MVGNQNGAKPWAIPGSTAQRGRPTLSTNLIQQTPCLSQPHFDSPLRMSHCSQLLVWTSNQWWMNRLEDLDILFRELYKSMEINWICRTWLAFLKTVFCSQMNSWNARCMWGNNTVSVTLMETHPDPPRPSSLPAMPYFPEFSHCRICIHILHILTQFPRHHLHQQGLTHILQFCLLHIAAGLHVLLSHKEDQCLVKDWSKAWPALPRPRPRPPLSSTQLCKRSKQISIFPSSFPGIR